MVVFKKPAVTSLPVHSARTEHVSESLATFYKQLLEHQNSSDEEFNVFLDLEKLIPLTIAHLLEHTGPPEEVMELLKGLNTKRNFLVSPTVKGQSTCSILVSPLQAMVNFKMSGLLCTPHGRNLLGRMMYFPPSIGSSSYTQSNATLFLWWDTLNSRGKFLQPFEASSHIEVDLAKPLSCTIIMCTQTALTHKKNIKRVFDLTGIRYSSFNLNTEIIDINPDFHFGTYISVPSATLFSRTILSQKAAFFRRKFFSVINDLIFDNNIWRLAFHCSASGRKNTVEQYISHIRSFADWTGLTVAEIFQHMRNCCLDDDLLEKFFLRRLSLVNIDTVIQGIHAFNWFYRRFHRTKHANFHERVVTTILSLRKRLKQEKNGSDSLSWEKMKILLANILNFDWKPFKAKDIYHLAVISLWGALRISESTSISRLTAVLLFRQELLRVSVYDAKSASGDKLQWKYICSFPNHPDFCPHEAFKQLSKVDHYNTLVSDNKGKPLTTTKLSALFRKFILSLKDRDILPRDKKFTWHVFRVSYMNISFDEFELPLHFCAANACHKALASSRGYVSRREEKRRMLAAKNFASKASKQMSNDTDLAVLAFLKLSQPEKSV